MKRMTDSLGYKVYQMNEIGGKIMPLQINAFMCFNAQEDRAAKALSELQNHGLLRDALVLSFDNDSLPNAEGLNIVAFIVDQSLSSNMLSCLKKIDEYVKNKNSIGIDITCMPIPFFTQILNFLFKKHKDKQIIIYYTEPVHYTLDNLFDYSAYGGEIEIKAIPGFEGETSQIDEVKRIVFYLMGFEMKYLSKLIPQDVNPNKIAPISGFPSYFPKYKDISLINNNTDFHEKDIEIIFSEANNPFEAYNTMVTLKNKYKEFRVDIMPVGTKPMALGACLFALKSGDNNCRIIFPFPAMYKSNQSAGCGKLWEYRVNG